MRSAWPKPMLNFHADLTLQTKILLARIGIVPHDIRFDGSYGNSLITWNGCLTIELQRAFISFKLILLLQKHFHALDIEWAPVSQVCINPKWIEVQSWAFRLIQIDKSLYQHTVSKEFLSTLEPLMSAEQANMDQP